VVGRQGTGCLAALAQEFRNLAPPDLVNARHDADRHDTANRLPDGPAPGAASRAALRAAIPEDRALGAISASSNWRHPVKRETRATVVPEVEAWYVTPVGTGDQRLSYVEAVKKYPLQPEDDGCGLETFASGWVHHDGQRQRIKASLAAVVTYCDRRGVSYMLPFGQMRVNDRVHWIVQMSGRDHEWYAVVEGTADRVKYVAEFQAGSVPLNR
jgi:hypothetical protein